MCYSEEHTLRTSAYSIRGFPWWVVQVLRQAVEVRLDQHGGEGVAFPSSQMRAEVTAHSPA